MDQVHCPVCLDLTHDLFDSKFAFTGSRQKPDSSVRYKAIKFKDLRAAALTGCQNCIVLKRGTGMFWGSNPEDWARNGKAVLVLESRKGNGLVSFRSPEDFPDMSVGEVGLRLEFFSESNDNALNPAFGRAYHLPRFLSKEAAACRLQSWLQCCEETHASCRAALTRLPDRVLDISGSTIRLVEVQHSEVPYGRYATLSHCWGDPEESVPTTSTKSNLDSRKAGIASADLTNLFKDTIQLCKDVGCDYLWIDSLCIIQDDNSDWTVQSQKMGEIYSNAHFNIAATSSHNSTDGLFKERWTLGSGLNFCRHPLLVYEINIPSVPGHKVFVRPAHSRDHKYLTEDLLHTRWDQAPLLQRAWVFQELLLARRILHVCASELIWECKSLIACECGRLDSNNTQTSLATTTLASDRLPLAQPHRKQEFTLIRDKQSSTQNIHDFWLRISQGYSSLDLTRPSDRLAAFTGLIKVVQGRTHGTHIAGMWMEDLPRALLWAGHTRSNPQANRSSDAPTWSWMSRRLPGGSCSMSYARLLFDGFRPDPKTSVTYVPGTNIFPGGDCFQIKFRGPTISASVESEFQDFRSHTEFYIRLVSHLRDPPDFHPHYLEVDCPMASDHPVRPGDMVECLLFGTNDDITCYYTLVVSKCLNGNEDYYKRIGVSDINLSGDKEAYSDIAEIRDITII